MEEELYEKEYTSIKNAWQNLIDNEKCSLKLLCGFTAGLKKQNQQWRHSYKKYSIRYQ